MHPTSKGVGCVRLRRIRVSATCGRTYLYLPAGVTAPARESYRAGHPIPAVFPGQTGRRIPNRS